MAKFESSVPKKEAKKVKPGQIIHFRKGKNLMSGAVIDHDKGNESMGVLAAAGNGKFKVMAVSYSQLDTVAAADGSANFLNAAEPVSVG